MSDPVRLALVGCGRIAQVAHLPAVEKAEGVELVAVCDPSAAVAGSVAGRYGLSAAYTDQGSVLADGSVEAVLIAAPDRFHHGLATEGLRAGRHVLVEKPLAATVREAGDLVELVDRTGLTLQVGAMKRHDEGVRYARRFIAEGIGGARSFSAWYRIGDLRPGIEATLFPPVFAEPGARRREAAGKA
ncbi:MAG TPA: Gfo/Idh/MocA family oxidoreductase, partial [Actinomycetota bacterium]|nr:Gfo/Idh/MocA family oxidoreductase [Actinomycetota bacterium]